MKAHEEQQIKHAKESGERSAKTDNKGTKPFYGVNFTKAVANNPYHLRTGNLGKKLKAAWHNGYREQFNALA